MQEVAASPQSGCSTFSPAAGNQLGDGVNTFTYDVENRIHTVTNGGVVTTYVYDAFGRRIRKTVGSSTTDYIYNLGGTAVAEVNGSGTWTRGEVFVGGKHVATYASGASGTTYFAHVDWLGTERVHSNVSGAACETVTSLIFGDGTATSGSCGDPSTRHFTGKERDAESGLDYFGARSYSSQFGRFAIADWSAAPVPVPYADLTNPQSLNLYALVRGNPSTFADLDGHLAPGQLGFSGGMGITPKMRSGGGSAYGCQDTGCDSHITVWEVTVDGVGTGEFFDSQAAGRAYVADLYAPSPQGLLSQQSNLGQDKRTDVMLSADSIPPQPSTRGGAQFEMDYRIVPQADTMEQLQNNVAKVNNDPTTQATYSKMEVKLWESQRGQEWGWQGTLTGKAHDVLNVFATRVDQRWYIDGKRVQMVIGKDSSGQLIKAWTVHVEITTHGPVFSKVD